MAPPPAIELSLAWLQRKLGRAIEPAEVRRILESLAFGVTEAGPGKFLVTVPSWRATKDVAIKDDLVEEVGRMVGYDSITPQAPLVPAAVPPGNPSRRFQHDVRNLFVDNGFTEVYNYSFLSEESVRAFGFDPASHVRVTNPIASNQELMRASLLPGIWKNVTDNAKHRESFRLFEIGLEIHRKEQGLPEEIPHLVAALYDRQDGGIFELKRVAECLLAGARTVPVEARELRASRAGGGDCVEGRGGGTAVRAASQVRGDRAGGDPRSGSAAGGVAERRAGQIHADPALSIERVRLVGDRPVARARGQAGSGDRGFRGAAAGVDPICAAICGAAARGGHEERVVPADGGLAGANAVVGGDRCDPRCDYRSDAGIGVRTPSLTAGKPGTDGTFSGFLGHPLSRGITAGNRILLTFQREDVFWGAPCENRKTFRLSPGFPG